MKELIKLGTKTYCLKNPVNIGIYLLSENNVCVIDTGNSKDYGKLIASVLEENNWNLKYIINTHSHADHIGGNKYLQNKYSCEIFSSKNESVFINEPLLEPALLYGANPPMGMNHHLLKADASLCNDIENMNIDGLKIINLEGHSYGQIGVVTDDNVIFVGDAYTSEKILEKYSIQYIYDVKKYLSTLELLKETNYKFYVPAHGEINSLWKESIQANVDKVYEIEKAILNIVNKKITYHDLLKMIFEKFNINLNIMQYHLISATVKAYLTKLEEDKKIEFGFEDNELIIFENENN